jgi:hypothetical protein
MVNRPSAYNQFKAVPDNKAWSGLEQSGEPIDLELPEGVRLFATGITIPETTDEENWKAIGIKLVTIEKSSNFARGDWWSFGEHKYGDRAEVARKLHLDFDYLCTLGWVCRKVPTSSRKEGLSFKHHEAVAKLEPELQEKWLTRAFRGDARPGTLAKPWSVSKLRQKIYDQEQTHRAMDDRELEQNDPDEFKREMAKRVFKDACGLFDKVTRDPLLRNTIQSFSDPDMPFLKQLSENSIAEMIKKAISIRDEFNEVVEVLTLHQKRRKPRDTDTNEPSEPADVQVEIEVPKTPVKREPLPTKTNRRDAKRKRAA